MTTGGKIIYRWNHKPFSDEIVSRFSPLSIDLIDIRRIDPSFEEQIKSLPIILQRDYQRRFSSRIQYEIRYQNYGKSKTRPTYWLSASATIGGNLPWLVDNLSVKGSDGNTNDQLLFNRIFYGQYLKLSVENKWKIPIQGRSELVFRGLLGGSLTYNGTPTVPL